ncbi:hypothetical protein OS493_020002 [Desmophyllum pertusum]|uniref:Periphilin-1 C-terminal domain-containing protein n=1 Tax=Desmophyllum pertusum TaxID=174260 RepID=A0A9W9YBC1_9CNID|nr:hypothetical protein OS493_020002 [Desmophyllum pertusum]
MDTTLGKSWTLGKNSSLGSTSTPVYCEQLPALERIPTVEVEKRKEEKDPNGRVEPLFHNGSFISDAPLEPSKDTTEDGDQEVIKISATSNSAGSDTTMLPAVDGDNSADYVVTASISSVNKESAVFSTNSDGNLLPLGSTPENEMSLVSQTPLELRQKDVITEHSRSTDRTPSQITEGGSNWDTSNLMSCVSDETRVTSEVIDKRFLASESEGCGFVLDDEETSLLKSPVQGSSVSEVEGGNEKNVQSEFICSKMQQQVLPLKTVQTLSNSPPRCANKRTHHDSTSEASRPCKVPRKPLKLIIPASQPSSRGVKRTANRGYLGRHSKKTSTCTITRADVDLVPETSSSSCMLGNGSAITELYTCDKDAMIAEKDSSSENGELMCTLSPAISRMDGSETNSLSVTGSLLPTCQTGNTSPLTAHLSPYNQTPTSAENNNIKEQMAQSCDGKESDWVTLKMERLRKKKEDIEQVYKKECHTVVNVVKMLVSNDPRLEGLLQNAVRRSLQEMGQRCVQELVKQARPGT